MSSILHSMCIEMLLLLTSLRQYDLMSGSCILSKNYKDFVKDLRCQIDSKIPKCAIYVSYLENALGPFKEYTCLIVSVSLRYWLFNLSLIISSEISMILGYLFIHWRLNDINITPSF